MAIQEIVCSLFKLGASCVSMPLDTLLVEYLLVPSVLMIILLYVTTNAFLRGTSLKIKSLLAVTFYIIMVYSGWYGTVALFMYNFATMFLIVGIVFFVLTRFISPSKMRDIGKFGMSLGELKYDIKMIEDRVHNKDLEIKELDRMMDDMRKEGTLKDSDLSVINMIKQEVNRELKLLDSQAKRGRQIIPTLSSSQRKKEMESYNDKFRSIELKIDEIRDEVRKLKRKIEFGNKDEDKRVKELEREIERLKKKHIS